MSQGVRRSVLYLPFYAACIALASILWSQPTLLLLGYAALSGVMLWRWHRADDLAFYFVPFVLGPVGEAIAIYSGAWQYSRPWMLVPVWLPFAWGCASLYMKSTAEALTTRSQPPSTPRISESA